MEFKIRHLGNFVKGVVFSKNGKAIANVTTTVNEEEAWKFTEDTIHIAQAIAALPYMDGAVAVYEKKGYYVKHLIYYISEACPDIIVTPNGSEYKFRATLNKNKALCLPSKHWPFNLPVKLEETSSVAVKPLEEFLAVSRCR